MKPNIKFLHSLFEVSHIEYQSYDLTSQKLLFSSGIAQKVLGYSEAEYLAFSENYFNKLVHPDDRQKVEDTINKICGAKNGEILEMDVRMRRADGNYSWIYSRQMILERGNGKKHCSIIREAEDITEFKQIQADLETNVERLRIVSYKNSHLLRSPVASIIGLMNLIEETNITSAHNMEVFRYLKETIVKLDETIHEINKIANEG